jgi:L-lactate utilization protein LutB
MDRIQKTIEAARERGIKAELVDSKENALARVQELIPAGVTIYNGASITLGQIGFDELLKTGSHPWRNLKGEALAEKDMARQMALRRQGVLADYYLGSVHAIAETGEIVVASATGSQLAAYAYSSQNIIWVAGAQKIVPSLEDAIRRIREHSLPTEDSNAKNAGRPGSMIGKLLIFEREAAYLKRNLVLLIVNEVLGV